MRIFLYGFVFGFFLSFCAPCCAGVAAAQGPTEEGWELYRLPEGTRLQTPEGTFQGFTLGEYQELLRMDADLWYYDQYVPLLEKTADELLDIIEAQDSKIESLNLLVDLLSDERDYLAEAWLEENKKRHEAENRPRIGSVFAWIWAGLSTVASLVLLGVVAL